MWKCVNLRLLRKTLTQEYSTKSKSKSRREGLRRKVSVLKQDLDKFPVIEFNRSKPTDRRVYVWGEAVTGACGVNESLQSQKLAKQVRCPTRLPFAERFDVIDIAAGYGYTLFACKPEKDGTSLFGCGLNTDSQLGYHRHGGETNRPIELLIYPAPVPLPSGQNDDNKEIKKVAAGRAHSIALSKSNILYTFGNNSYGQCGRGIVEGEVFHSSQMVHHVDVKTIIGDDDNVKDIVCGLDHSLLLTEKGNVYTCGWNGDGQLGLGHFNSTDHWCQVLGDIKNEKITKVASKFDCVLALNGKQQRINFKGATFLTNFLKILLF